MLVLTRRPDSGDQSAIKVGNDIEITVVEVRGDQIRIGITAPDDVAIWRRELWDAKQEEVKLSKN